MSKTPIGNPELGQLRDLERDFAIEATGPTTTIDTIGALLAIARSVNSLAGSVDALAEQQQAQHDELLKTINRAAGTISGNPHTRDYDY